MTDAIRMQIAQMEKARTLVHVTQDLQGMDSIVQVRIYLDHFEYT